MKDQIEEFRAYRAKMNERILAADNKVIKRIYNIDTNTYMEGALSSKVKEMLGLATSMVLRCDDCIKYHLEKCYEQGVTTPELFEVFAVADVWFDGWKLPRPLLSQSRVLLLPILRRVQ